MLRLYYTSLKNIDEKYAFISEAASRCRVRHSTIRSWISKPTTVQHRIPKPIYRSILSELTGIDESKLFES